MGIEYKDIIRHEDSTAFLPESSKVGQVTFENDGLFRQRRTLISNNAVTLHWTPDQYFTSDLVGYTNGSFPALTDLKLATDYLLGNTILSIEPIYLVSSNVGIGTTNPLVKLQVEGNIRSYTSSSSSASFEGYTTGRLINCKLGSYNSDDAALNLYVADGTTENVRLNTNGVSFLMGGNVGIGTTNPTKTLDISGQMSVSSTIYCASNIVSNSTVGLTIKMDTEDGSDDKYIAICSGGDNLPSRGASIILCGNDEASTPGDLFLKNGDNGNIAMIGQTYINIKPTNNLYDFAIGKYMTFKDFGDESLITHNAYYEFGVGWKYRENGHGATSLGVDSTGLHVRAAEEGVKDAAINWNNGLTVNNDGKVGIGTNNPVTKLQVNGNMRITENLLVGYETTGSTSSPAFLSLGTSQADTPVREKCKLYLYSDASTELYGFGVGIDSDIQYHSNGTHDFFVENNKIASVNNNGIGIGTQNPTEYLDVNGNARIRSIGSGTYAGTLGYTSDGTLTVSTSDARLKHDIQPVDEFLTLQKVLDLKPVNFKWNGTELQDVGLIAQDVEQVMPELAFTNPNDGYMGVHYSKIVAPLISCIQSLYKKIEILEKKLETL